MRQEYAISTFCYGDRYHKQSNRLIESFDYLEEKPDIFIVTDSPEAIIQRDFVKTKHINDYNPKYSNYLKDNYYAFDFSVKRFSLLFAFESGYDRAILTDTDAVANPPIYNHETMMKTFYDNSITGQVTYNFKDSIDTNNMLGRRFAHYEKKYNVEFDKNLLDEMVEDCIQFVSINNGKKIDFINTWSDLIKIKEEDNLHNVPAGNIDEMCFSGLLHGINNKNSSKESVNTLIAKHEKWY